MSKAVFVNFLLSRFFWFRETSLKCFWNCCQQVIRTKPANLFFIDNELDHDNDILGDLVFKSNKR